MRQKPDTIRLKRAIIITTSTASMSVNMSTLKIVTIMIYLISTTQCLILTTMILTSTLESITMRTLNIIHLTMSSATIQKSNTITHAIDTSQRILTTQLDK